MNRSGTPTAILAILWPLLSTTALAQPEPIGDFFGTGRTQTSITLSWTSPAVAVLSYDVRYSMIDPYSADAIDPTVPSLSDWYSTVATHAAGEPVPSGPNSHESMELSGLLPGMIYVIAMTSTNAAGQSDISVTWEMTPPPPPQRVTHLDVSERYRFDVTLAWLNSDHPPTTCTVAYSTTGEITDDTFDTVYAQHASWRTTFDIAAPPGTQVTFKLTGLQMSTHYWIAIRSSDQWGARSPVSNNVEATTLDPDLTPPVAVTGLTLTSFSETSAVLTCPVPDDPGGGHVYSLRLKWSTVGPIDENEKFDPQSFIDYSYIINPGVAGTIATLQATGLEASKKYWFSVRAMDDSDNWSDVSNSDQFRPAMVDTVPPATIALIHFNHERWAFSVNLRWQSVGNDGVYGTAAAYDLRYSTSPITGDNFDEAEQDRSIQAPGHHPYWEEHTVPGLLQQTPYYFAIKAGDDATPTNWGAMSNVVMVTTLDGLPPDAITDLHVKSIEFCHVTLGWTATGDDGVEGTATEYIIKYSTHPATHPDWWNSALPVNAPQGDRPRVSGPLGTPEACRAFIPLFLGETCWIAIKAVDENGNEGAISSIVPTPTVPDTFPPAPVANLKYRFVSSIGFDKNELTWMAPGDSPGNQMLIKVSGYDLRFSTSDPADPAFATIEDWWRQANGIDAPQAPLHPGGLETSDHRGVVSGIYFYAIRSVDAYGNWSAISNISRAEIYLPDIRPTGWMDNLTAIQTLSKSVTLEWNAPYGGSNDPDGPARSYMLRYSTTDPVGFSFRSWLSQATPALPMPVPGLPETTDSVKVTRLVPDTTYYFAIVAFDGIGAVIGFSYPLTVRTRSADAGPPAAIGDLAVSLRQSTYLILAWTAPGDDGHSGTPLQYEIHGSAEDAGSEPIEGWWSASTRITNSSSIRTIIPLPSIAGTRESVRIDGLIPDTDYHFAIRAMDDDENWSPIPSPLAARTEPPDVVPPAAITTLRAFDVAGTTDISLAWEAEGEDGAGSERAVDRYEIRYSTRDPGSFASADSWWDHATPYVEEEVAPALPGRLQTATIRNLAPDEYYLAVKSVDEAPNLSGLSNVAPILTFPVGSVGDGKVCSASPLHRATSLSGCLAVLSLLALRSARLK